MKGILTPGDLAEAVARKTGFERKFVMIVIKSFLKVLPDLIISGGILRILGLGDLGLHHTSSGNIRLRIKVSRKVLKKIGEVNVSAGEAVRGDGQQTEELE